jgi:hypothetical protein
MLAKASQEGASRALIAKERGAARPWLTCAEYPYRGAGRSRKYPSWC